MRHDARIGGIDAYLWSQERHTACVLRSRAYSEKQTSHTGLMKKDAYFLAPLFLAFVVLTSGCATFIGAGGVPRGTILTEVKGPVATQTFEMAVQAGELKKGTSSAEGFLGLVAQGDASIQAAAEDGGITNIHHIDFETRSILGLYVKYTTVVYGQ